MKFVKNKFAFVLSFFVLLILFSAFRFFDGPIFTPSFTVYNFDTIEQGTWIHGKIPFQNTGKQPLLISWASASNDRTVISYPNEPIAPGKWDTLYILFTSEGTRGPQNKMITVQHNGENGMSVLQLKGYVLERKNIPLPALPTPAAPMPPK
jgi:hypothetical protein